MRIWIINHYGAPPTCPGGTRHYNFACQLQKRGHEVLIIAANFNHLSHTLMVPPDQADKIDYSYSVPFLWLSVPKYKGNTVARFWNMLAFARNILTNQDLRTQSTPDVIIGSSPHLFAAFSAYRLAKRLKKTFCVRNT